MLKENTKVLAKVIEKPSWKNRRAGEETVREDKYQQHKSPTRFAPWSGRGILLKLKHEKRFSFKFGKNRVLNQWRDYDFKALKLIHRLQE